MVKNRDDYNPKASVRLSGGAERFPMTEKLETKSNTAIAELARLMERIVSQQRQMSHYLMLLQEERGADERDRKSVV